jgi:hypothetical protein
MRAEAAISVREYPLTSFCPDCDYLDGVVVERNPGEYEHAKSTRAVLVHFHLRRKEWGVHVLPERRIQVSPTRFRVPDVCSLAGPDPQKQILGTRPFLCIAMLSPEDRLSAMQARVGDFLSMGMPYIFTLDPKDRRARRCNEGLHQVNELRTKNPTVLVPIEALFEE